MRQFLTIFIVLVAVTSVGPAEAGNTFLIGISPVANQLAEINPADASEVSTVAMTLDIGGTILGGNALATDPTNGVLYGVLKLDMQAGRELVTLNPLTGAAVSIGDTGEKFASLTFDSSGQLWGVTGDGGTVPETLFTIDKSNATSTMFMALGNGDDGESIEFNPEDGLIYHLSGIVSIFESIDTSTMMVTDIGTSEVMEEVFSMVYAGGGAFLVTTIGDSMFNMTTTGAMTLIGTMDNSYRGMAFVDDLSPIESVSWGRIKSQF